MTFDTRSLDNFADRIHHHKNLYLAAIDEAVYIRVESVAEQKRQGVDDLDYGKLFAWDALIAELIHRQLFANWDAEDPPDPRREQAKHVLRKLVKLVEDTRKATGNG